MARRASCYATFARNTSGVTACARNEETVGAQSGVAPAWTDTGAGGIASFTQMDPQLTFLYDDGDREYNVAAENYEVTAMAAPEEALGVEPRSAALPAQLLHRT